MTVHLLKLCVGADTIQDLQNWVDRRTKSNTLNGLGAVHDHLTRMFPKRRDELMDGGSIYWVIKGHILVRQKIIGLEPVVGPDNVERCAILLDPPLIPTHAYPRKAFQGWRYLSDDDAPKDIVPIAAYKAGRLRKQKRPSAELQKEMAKAEAQLRAELAELGLL
ncbi:MAG: DUF1489 domain-containing protein [Pseudomonadota bacterium]